MGQGQVWPKGGSSPNPSPTPTARTLRAAMHSPSCDPDSALLDTASDRALPLGPQAAQTVQTGALRGCGHPYECTERMFCLGPGPFQSKLGIFPQCHVRKGCPNPELIQGCAFERRRGPPRGRGSCTEGHLESVLLVSGLLWSRGRAGAGGVAVLLREWLAEGSSFP